MVAPFQCVGHIALAILGWGWLSRNGGSVFGECSRSGCSANVRRSSGGPRMANPCIRHERNAPKSVSHALHAPHMRYSLPCGSRIGNLLNRELRVAPTTI